jgi:hypothetical protein
MNDGVHYCIRARQDAPRGHLRGLPARRLKLSDESEAIKDVSS